MELYQLVLHVSHHGGCEQQGGYYVHQRLLEVGCGVIPVLSPWISPWWLWLAGCLLTTRWVPTFTKEDGVWNYPSSFSMYLTIVAVAGWASVNNKVGTYIYQRGWGVELSQFFLHISHHGGCGWLSVCDKFPGLKQLPRMMACASLPVAWMIFS